jgi:hypothetical protein
MRVAARKLLQLLFLGAIACADPPPQPPAAPTPPPPPPIETAEPARAPIAVTERTATDAAAPVALKLGLSHVQVNTVVEDSAPTISRACLARGAPVNRGEVYFGFRIGVAGDVVDAWLVGTTFHEPKLEECVLRQVRELRFPTAEVSTLRPRMVLLIRPDGVAVVHPNAGAPDGGASKGLRQDEVRNVVTAHAAEIRACYEDEARKNASLDGMVKIAWDIEKSGVVSRAWVAASTLTNTSVEGCLIRAVQSWRFPASDVPTKVAGFPFNIAAR